MTASSLTLFWPERLRVLLAYGLLLIEEISLLALPALIGLTIDRLLASDRSGLFLLAGGVAAVLLCGALRRFYDTRVFATAEQRLSQAVMSAPDPPGVKVARLRQVHEVVQTYERSVPEGLAAVTAGVGSLLVSALYDWRVGLGALVATVALIGMDRLYAGKVERLNTALNDRTECELDVLNQSRPGSLRAHLTERRGLRVARSDAEIGVYLLNWIVLLALIVGTLALIATPGVTPGAVFAQLSYILAFAESWNRWPLLTERLSHARDVTRRLQSCLQADG
ncbi:ABC transporter six-transmembrane domain-containing protein [Brevundimonas sp.]|uniref:ABC transporter six-transmembrane domain-containing protein n=1 Tax=Brevundimonas sp. TaxID=1871086 RepID=UPI002619773E|nr:ABC transporter six-transmembrane domain-containing protein [Brevundimonas sp.]